MLAVANSPNIFQNFEWEFEDHGIGIMMETTTGEQPTLESFDDLLDYAMLQDHDIDGGLGESPPLSGSAGSGSGDDHRMVKKRQNHNESERDRRKKINALFSSLRTLLPASDLTKKLSIPSTVGRVLKYIPELEKEVEELTQKKQEILLKTSEDQSFKTFQDQGRPAKRSKITNSSLSIDIQKMEEREIVVHVSASQRIKSLPEVLLLLEKAAFLVIHVSSFQSFGGKTFYSLHLTKEGTKIVELESLKKKLSTLLEKQN